MLDYDATPDIIMTSILQAFMPLTCILTNIREPAMRVLTEKEKQTITSVYSVRKLAGTKNAILTVSDD